MAKFRVHKVCFYQPELPPIQCITYNRSLQKIVLSRFDASIEIWDMSTDCLFRESVIAPAAGGSIESLAWCGNRLFSVGLTGVIMEYDLLNLKPKLSIPTFNGACWAVAVDSTETRLAVCTETGCLCIFEIRDDSLQALEPTERQSGRLLCLAWHESGEIIVTGSMNALLIWNVKTGCTTGKMNVGLRADNTDIIVWCVGVTKDFQAVSGDSTGKVCFWDCKTGVLIQSIPTHIADVLCLVIMDEDDAIWASGVDPLVVCCNRNLMQNTKKWIKSTIIRSHTHDVRALAKTENFLVSGGVDCKLTLTKSSPKLTYSYPAFLRVPCMTVAVVPNLVLLQYSQKLELWRLGDTRDSSDANETNLILSSERLKLIELTTKNSEVITASTLSSDGKWMAYSTGSGVRIFLVDLDDIKGKIPKVAVTRVRSLSKECHPARALEFAVHKETELISLLPCGSIQIFGVDLLQPTVKAINYNDDESSCGAHLLCLSNDGKSAAVGHHDGTIIIYDLKTRKEYCRLPKYRFQATAMSFTPDKTELVVAYQNRKIIGINIKTQVYSEWANNLAHLSESTMPRCAFTFNGITFSPSNPEFIILHDFTRVYLINTKILSYENFARKEREEIIKLSRKYNNLVHFIGLQDDFAIALEIQPVTVLENLPAQLMKKRYGT